MFYQNLDPLIMHAYKSIRSQLTGTNFGKSLLVFYYYKSRLIWVWILQRVKRFSRALITHAFTFNSQIHRPVSLTPKLWLAISTLTHQHTKNKILDTMKVNRLKISTLISELSNFNISSKQLSKRGKYSELKKLRFGIIANSLY